jgi:hypothetical protein
VGLIPDQSAAVFGVELLVISGFAWAGTLIAYLHRGLPAEFRGYHIQAFVTLQCALAPFLIGGVTLLLAGGGGFYWVAAGVALSFVVALGHAWVLLVEILR